MNGMEMLLAPLFKQLGVSPDEIKEAVVLITDTMLELRDGQARIEAKLDRLLMTGTLPVIDVETDGERPNAD